MVTVVVVVAVGGGGDVVAEETVVGGPVGACVRLKEGGAGPGSVGLTVTFGGPRRKRIFFSTVQYFTGSLQNPFFCLYCSICVVSWGGTFLCPHNHAAQKGRDGDVMASLSRKIEPNCPFKRVNNKSNVILVDMGRTCDGDMILGRGPKG